MKQLIVIFSLAVTGLTNVSSFSQSAVVSATSMNVMYRGLENPIEIASCGYAPNQLIVTCTGGSIIGDSGKYNVKPGTDKVVIISVSAKTSNITLGEYKFKVKAVPTPVITWGGIFNGGSISSSIASTSPLIPRLEDFDFVVYAVIKSFNINFIDGGALNTMSITGNQIPGSLESKIKGLQKGTTIYFDEIKLSISGGDSRTTVAVFTIQ